MVAEANGHENADARLQIHNPSSLEPRNRIGEIVAIAILREIVLADPTSGTFLPSEKNLAALYDVGRSAIREALSLLATTGVVRSLHGRGTLIQDESGWNVLSPLVVTALEGTDRERKLNADLFDVRVILEDHAAVFAAREATTTERAGLVALAENLEHLALDPNVTTRELLNSDQAFHDVVATISGNAVLRQIIREVHVHSAMAWDNLEMDKDEHVRIAARHMAVAVAISEGNVEATRLAVADHMESVREEQTTKGSIAGSSSSD